MGDEGGEVKGFWMRHETIYMIAPPPLIDSNLAVDFL